MLSNSSITSWQTLVSALRFTRAQGFAAAVWIDHRSRGSIDRLPIMLVTSPRDPAHIWRFFDKNWRLFFSGNLGWLAGFTFNDCICQSIMIYSLPHLLAFFICAASTAVAVVSIPFVKYNSPGTKDSIHNDILLTYAKYGWELPSTSTIRKRAVVLGVGSTG